MSYTIRVLILFISLLFCNCSKNSFDTKEELVSYLQDDTNGYIQSKHINGYDFTVMYRPTDLLVNQELSSLKVANDTKNKIKRKYDPYLYFSIKMSRDKKELLSTTPNNRTEFGILVNQLAFEMKEKVYMITSKKDTIETIDFIYPRLYGMTYNTEMLFVFAKDEEKLKQEFLDIKIQDFGLHTGEVSFKFKTDKINNQPTLKF